MAPRNSRKGSKFIEGPPPNYGDLAMKKMVIFQRYLKNYYRVRHFLEILSFLNG